MHFWLSELFIDEKGVICENLGIILLESIPDDLEVRGDKTEDHFQEKQMVSAFIYQLCNFSYD